jgi:3-dehydroquinate synthase
MREIRVELGERSYRIAIGSGILPDLGKSLKEFGFTRKTALISNPTVFGLYGRRAAESLKDAGFEVSVIVVPDGEEYKSLSSVQQIYGEMLTAALDRRSVLIALGGGVIGDMAGFAASTYMRGIDFVQVPTTLLAQVDSSVGGKTGVNHPMGKNMIGTFWQPRLVWIDIDTLRSLPRREFLSGLAEVIKYGVIWDEGFFRFLEEGRDKVLNLDNDILSRVVQSSCEIKAKVVAKDERESGLRAILNYGHTLGHAIETATGYKKYLHGEAVAIGMYEEAGLSKELGLLDAGQLARIKSLIEAFDLPAALPQDIDQQVFLQSMKLDKKTVQGDITFILPEKIGKVRIHKGLSLKEIEKVFGKKD